MPIIVFGGSFDPIHNGHLRIAKAASAFLSSPVLFVPAKAPRWKKTLATSFDRVAMLERALKEAGDPLFSLDLREMRRPGDLSYSVDTVRELKDENPGAELYFLIGADSIARFHEWKDAETLAKTARIVYSPRPGYPDGGENVDRFRMIRLPFEESGVVSSTDFRRLKNVDVPRSVRDYIEEKRLYYAADIFQRLSERRALHSLSVARLAEDIVTSNNLTSLKGKGYIAGALHDLAKPLDDEEGRHLARLYDPSLDVSKIPPYAVHAFAGAYLAKEEYKIEDRDILDAILYHCTGRANMSPLEKIVYAADKTEPTRGYDSSGMIAALKRDYDEGFKLVLKENRAFLRVKNCFPELDSRSEECFRYYLGGE